MFFIFDNLNAILIGATVILVLSLIQIGAQRTGLEQTTSYSTKTKAISFGEWLEDDILSIGANFGRNRYRFLPPDTTAEGNTSRFVFFSDSTLASGDTLRLMTRYRLVTTQVVTRGEVETQLFQLQRHVAQVPVVNGSAPVPSDNSSAWRDSGRSLGTLSAFHIGLLMRDGRETTDVAVADYLRIQYRLVPEFPIEPEYMRELYWTTTLKIRPFWEPPPGT